MNSEVIELQNFITKIQCRADIINLQVLIHFVSHKLQEHLFGTFTFSGYTFILV